MRAVDTQVLVRLVAGDNREQCQAAEAFVASGAWVSHQVLAETVWALDALHERTHEQIVTAIDLLLNHKALTIQDASVVSAALQQFQKLPALGFSDCLVQQIACNTG